MSSTLHEIILLTSGNFKGPIFWPVPRRCRRWGVSKAMHGWAFPYPEQILDRSLATPLYEKSLKKNLRLSMQPYFAIICSFIYEKYSTKYLSCGQCHALRYEQSLHNDSNRHHCSRTCLRKNSTCLGFRRTRGCLNWPRNAEVVSNWNCRNPLNVPGLTVITCGESEDGIINLGPRVVWEFQKTADITSIGLSMKYHFERFVIPRQTPGAWHSAISVFHPAINFQFGKIGERDIRRRSRRLSNPCFRPIRLPVSES